jgi:hypothetical protein
MPATALSVVRTITVALAAAASCSAALADPVQILAYDGAIGVDPLTAAGGVDVPNTVRGVSPGGRAWVIRKFSAEVYDDASVVARGKGLLFSSGENIGTRGGVTHVAATLACGAPDSTSTKYTTGPFALDLAGNFTIRGFLSADGVNNAVLPSPCENPMLLIRASNPTTGAAGGWFAAGIRALD